jgi:hypothetical protein
MILAEYAIKNQCSREKGPFLLEISSWIKNLLPLIFYVRIAFLNEHVIIKTLNTNFTSSFFQKELKRKGSQAWAE